MALNVPFRGSALAGTVPNAPAAEAGHPILLAVLSTVTTLATVIAAAARRPRALGAI